MRGKIRGKLLVSTIIFAVIIVLIEAFAIYCMLSGTDMIYARIIAVILSLFIAYTILRALIRSSIRKQGEQDDNERFGGRA